MVTEKLDAISLRLHINVQKLKLLATCNLQKRDRHKIDLKTI